MDSNQPAIVCQAVTKRYGATLALDEVSFKAEFGAITGLLGPNGAGKTTLIRVLTTILRPTSGEFRVAGCAGTDSLGIKSRVGVLAESGGYPKRKRAVDHLAYHGRLYGLTPRDSQARSSSLLNLVGLSKRGSDHIGTFSRGMRQRLGIARAMINEPNILFLDEPTLGLDPAGQREILELIGVLARERQVSVILTSHLLDEIERSCDQIVILDQGRVVLDRSVLDALTPTDQTPVVRIVADPDFQQDMVAVVHRLGLESILEASGELAVSLSDEVTIAQLLTALGTAGIGLRRFDAGHRRLAEAFRELTGS